MEQILSVPPKAVNRDFNNTKNEKLMNKTIASCLQLRLKSLNISLENNVEWPNSKLDSMDPQRSIFFLFLNLNAVDINNYVFG